MVTIQSQNFGVEIEMTAVWSLFSCPMNWTKRTRRMPPTGSAATAIWKLTTAPMTAQGRSSRIGSICSGGAVTGLYITRLAETFEEEVQ